MLPMHIYLHLRIPQQMEDTLSQRASRISQKSCNYCVNSTLLCLLLRSKCPLYYHENGVWMCDLGMLIYWLLMRKSIGFAGVTMRSRLLWSIKSRKKEQRAWVWSSFLWEKASRKLLKAWLRRSSWKALPLFSMSD